MEKNGEIKETLKFYELSNRLKTKILDEVNNYSIADNIFGSMILSIAMDSEYKESQNLTKILRMLFLNEFGKLNQDYHYNNLKLGMQFENEIKDTYSLDTNESKLVFKYKSLDMFLTKLIANSKLDSNYLELLKESNKVFILFGNENKVKNEEIFKFYYLNFRLKNKVRSGWDDKHWNVKSDRIERISEHVVGTIALAIALQSEFEYDFNFDKILKMLAIHEIGETLIGDITPFDGITPEKKKEIEHSAMIDVLGNLEDNSILLEMLFEFDEQNSKESKFAHYCDKIEADLQAKLYQDKGLQHSLNDQKNNCVFNSLKVQKMVQEGASTAFDIWYGWDKTIYENDLIFPEFFSMLKFARDNSLLQLNDGIVREKIFLSDEEYKILLGNSVSLIKDLYNDENVDCVYLTNYQSKNYEKGVLCYMILLNDGTNDFKYDLLTKKINEELENSNSSSIGIFFDCDYTHRYSSCSLNPSEVHRIETLSESTIIFDKSGKITDEKRKTKDYGHLYPFYLVDYVPPIEKSIVLKLTK